MKEQSPTRWQPRRGGNHISRNCSYDTWPRPQNLLDFAAINRSALAQLPVLLPRWLPTGKLVGHEYVALNPTRTDTRLGSFRININTARWSDFATGARGGDAISLFAYLFGLRQVEAARELASVLGIAEGGALSPCERQVTPHPSHPPISNTRRQSVPETRIREIWAASRWPHPTLSTYLDGRGLGALPNAPADIRLHPSLTYWHQVTNDYAPPTSLGQYPCIVALVRDTDGCVRGLHRTYLMPDGTAKLRLAEPTLPAKKLLSVAKGATRGAAIQLFPAAGRLAVAEGIETALAVHLSTGIPAWATVSASGMQAVQLPDSVKEVIIAADHDASGTGERSALMLAHRLLAQSCTAKIVMPTQCGTDWADALEVAHG